MNVYALQTARAGSKSVPNKNILNWAKKNKSKISVTKNPITSVQEADCVMTDKWISMSDKNNKNKKIKALKP